MSVTTDQVRAMNYTDFIALIKETNRCPGGKDTIRRIFNNLRTSDKTKVLEIGSNTGFTSLEVLHITETSIEGIDVSESCVAEANNRKALEDISLQKRVGFQVGSAYDVPFGDKEFDIVLAGGATAFMERKERAIQEYFRVLKDWGFLCITPLVYREDPPTELLKRLSGALGVEIKKMEEQDWVDLFLKNNENWELYYKERNPIGSVSADEVGKYIEYFIRKPHIVSLGNETKEAIRNKWRGYIEIFNENHKYLDYSIIVFRKTLYPEEPELFKTKAR